ncbi:hypothetical protein DFQ27_006934 [Actinomortierella ambigua]|uniref:Uncharacterized protein n=1 Tax=Actinomortierella ambigua TaxID=1343610 RepID=A0A9P6PXP6_9FUNG|nr:hypothetical protein DFQ27_006934 [Actinomortierella ambigua]
MTDIARHDGNRQSLSRPRDTSPLSGQQQQQQQEEGQEQQHPQPILVRTAQALKRTRARDILQDGASEIPAEKRAAIAKRDLFDHSTQQHAQAQSKTSSQFSSQSPSQRSSQQPLQRGASGDAATATTIRTTPLDSTILYSKTWRLHRTTPFYRYDPRQAARDGSELLSYMTANTPKLAMADTAAAHAAASVTASGDGESGNSGQPVSILAAAGGALSALSITERASRPFPPQINQDGESVVETVDVVNEVKSVVVQPLDLGSEEEEEEEEGVRKYPSNAFIISIVISYRGKTADQTSYVAIIDDSSRRANTIDEEATTNDRPSPFTPFALVMTKAPAALSALVMEWLERKYDCRICPLVFPTYELRSFVNHWLEYLYGGDGRNDDDVVQVLKKAKVKQVEMHYGFPAGVQGLKMISISLASEDVREMLNR